MWEKGELTQISPDFLSVTGMRGWCDQYVVYYGMASGGVQNTTGRLYRYDVGEKVVAALDETDTYVYTYVKPISDEEVFVCRNDRKLHGEFMTVWSAMSLTEAAI